MTKCRYCSQEFTWNNKNKKFCSPECWRLGRNKRVKNWRLGKKKLLIKNCKKCNILFETYSIKKIFCHHDCHRKYWDKINNDRKPRISNKRYFLSNELRATVHLTDKQYKFVLGSLLGDGSLILGSKNFYKFTTTHSERQKEYIEWKHELLKPFTTNGLIRYEVHDRVRVDGSPLVQYHSATICHDDFNRIYHILYRNGKKFVTRKYLNLIDEFALAVWYMDDGSYNKINTDMVLYTLGMTLSEHKAMKKWFWQGWGIICNIRQVKGKLSDGTPQIYYCLRFGRKETNKFHSLVGQYILPSMEYKLNPQRLYVRD